MEIVVAEIATIINIRGVITLRFPAATAAPVLPAAELELAPIACMAVQRPKSKL